MKSSPLKFSWQLREFRDENMPQVGMIVQLKTDLWQAGREGDRGTIITAHVSAGHSGTGGPNAPRSSDYIEIAFYNRDGSTRRVQESFQRLWHFYEFIGWDTRENLAKYNILFLPGDRVELLEDLTWWEKTVPKGALGTVEDSWPYAAKVLWDGFNKEDHGNTPHDSMKMVQLNSKYSSQLSPETLDSINWELDNVFTYGAKDTYDLTSKLIAKSSLEDTLNIQDVVLSYKDFPKRVRKFTKNYFARVIEEFPDLVAHLGTLKVFAAERPLYYDNDIGAEYFEVPNLILSYVPLEDLFTRYSNGLVHEIVHCVQYFLQKKGVSDITPDYNNIRYSKDSKFYLDDKGEKEARNAELTFIKETWQVQKESLEDFIGYLVDYEDADAKESINRFGVITRIEESTLINDPPGAQKVWGYWSDNPEYVMYMVTHPEGEKYFAETFWTMLPEDASKLKILKKVTNSFLKLSWSQFPALIQDLQEGDIIWDDANDKYRIKEIDHINRTVLLEEVFASGNFAGPFWINESDMLEHGFYKDPPRERFRRGMESSLKFSSLTDKNEQLFNQRYKNYGEDGGNLFWSDKENQYKRFRLLSDIGILNEATVLDVGAGFGDLLDYFEESNIKPLKYLGIDVVPAIIQIAKKKHPEYPFYVRDIIKEPFPDGSFDFCIGSGLFALNDKDWSESVVNLVKSMYNTCKKGVTVNFLSGHILSDMFRTTTKEEISKLIKDNVTNDMKIIETNDIEDITLYLYKQE